MVELNIRQILEYLPHRYPFVLIDRVLEFEANKRLLGLKNISYNEPYFQGHFPKFPVMPAVLILESMAQATGLLGLMSIGDVPSPDSVYYFVGIDQARFRKPVTPGDQMEVEVTHERTSRQIWRAGAKASVNGKVVADAKLMGALRQVGS